MKLRVFLPERLQEPAKCLGNAASRPTDLADSARLAKVVRLCAHELPDVFGFGFELFSTSEVTAHLQRELASDRTKAIPIHTPAVFPASSQSSNVQCGGVSLSGASLRFSLQSRPD